MSSILIRIAKALLRCLYSFMKLRQVRRRIVFVSRQSDSASYDYERLTEALQPYEVDIVILLKRQEKDNKKFLSSVVQNAAVILRQTIALSAAQVCITDGYSIPVSILNHRKELTIIQTWHAIGAIKKMGLQTLASMPPEERRRAELLDMHRGYDLAVAPSARTGIFFAEAFGLGADQIKIFGTPHIDYLYYGENDKREQIFKEYPQITKPVIAYIPTYRQGEPVPVSLLTEAFDFEKYDLIVRLHPIEAQGQKIDNRAIMIKGYTAEELLSVCDFVITDYSSICFDAGLTDIPIFFWIPDIDKYREYPGVNIDPAEEFPRYTSTDIKAILNMIGRDYDHEYLKNFISKYIGCYDGKCTERIIECIAKLFQ
jgi:CDP-ribitol ribitolphosphotransferase